MGADPDGRDERVTNSSRSLVKKRKIGKKVGDACLAVWSRSARIMYIVMIKLTSKELKGCKLALV